MENFISIAAGIIFGGLITIFVSRHYYRRASEELRSEAAVLRRETQDARHYINALISYLEAAGTIQVVRDEKGRPIKIKILKASAFAKPRSSASATGTLTGGNEDNENDKDAPPDQR